jgi:hypothetical protein
MESHLISLGVVLASLEYASYERAFCSRWFLIDFDWDFDCERLPVNMKKADASPGFVIGTCSCLVVRRLHPGVWV